MTAEEIYSLINKEVSEDLTLGATSKSKTADHRKIIYAVSSIGTIQQGLWEIKKRELEHAAESVSSTNALWWANKIKEFQYGHTLQVNSDYEYFYLVDDPASRIVTNVAVYSRPGKGLIKVAKAGPARLNEAELQSLRAFKNRVIPFGSNVEISSHDPDEAKISGSVYFDPIVPLTEVQSAVEVAVGEYLSSLDFQEGVQGTFYVTRLKEKILEVNGVVDFVSDEIIIRKNGNEASAVTIYRKFIPFAGYIIVHPNHPLSTTLIYSPDV